jgi:hypothetical protein
MLNLVSLKFNVSNISGLEHIKGSTLLIGELFTFITEELFNTINNSEELINYCRETNYNFPTTLDGYLEDLESFMSVSILRELSSNNDFAVVRDSDLKVCVVPKCFVVKLNN